MPRKKSRHLCVRACQPPVHSARATCPAPSGQALGAAPSDSTRRESGNQLQSGASTQTKKWAWPIGALLQLLPVCAVLAGLGRHCAVRLLAQHCHRQAHLIHVDARRHRLDVQHPCRVLRARGRRRRLSLRILVSPFLLSPTALSVSKARRGTGGRMPRPRAGAGTVSSSDSASCTLDTLRGTRRRPQPRCCSGSPERRLKKTTTYAAAPSRSCHRSGANAGGLSFRRGGKARRPHGRCCEMSPVAKVLTGARFSEIDLWHEAAE